jgi:hypothetical protein
MHVRKVLEKLRLAGLQADIKKYKFSVTRTKYLGCFININKIKVNPSKIEVIYN